MNKNIHHHYATQFSMSWDVGTGTLVQAESGRNVYSSSGALYMTTDGGLEYDGSDIDLRFTFDNQDINCWVGLTDYTGTFNSPSFLDHHWRYDAVAENFHVMELGAVMFTEAAGGDYDKLLRIVNDAGTIKYYMDGVLKYTSLVSPVANYKVGVVADANKVIEFKRI